MSALAEALEGYLTMRRGFGYKLVSQEARLKTFVRFMDDREASVVTGKLAVEWAGGGCRASTWSSRLSTVRSFARHLANHDPRTEIPPKGVFPPQRRPKPYILSTDEISDLLTAMESWVSEKGFQRWTWRCAFGLLAVTGMRSSEVISLKREDVDLCNGLLHVRDSKFGKSRIVPIDPTVATVLQGYCRLRDEQPICRVSPFFIVGERGAGLSHCTLHRVFMRWAQGAGLRVRGVRGGPRLHDLRHSFAVRSLERWYRAGDDIERKLPMLSTYLGHAHVRDTYWYLTAVPELMGHAAALLEQHWEALP